MTPGYMHPNNLFVAKIKERYEVNFSYRKNTQVHIPWCYMHLSNMSYR
jgi:hypothetical protein